LVVKKALIIWSAFPAGNPTPLSLAIDQLIGIDGRLPASACRVERLPPEYRSSASLVCQYRVFD
jgi:hypothetical protein